MAAVPPADSPLVRRFAVLAAAAAIGALATGLAGLPADVPAVLALAAAMLGAGALLLRRSRRHGEPAEQTRLVESLGLAGEEEVLALGDPRLAVAAAGHLPGGRAEASAFDVRDLPFPAGSFDAVVSCLALQDLPDRDARDRACSEIARIVRPGGRIALLEYFRITRDLELGLEDAGMQEVRRTGMRRAVFPPARRVSARRPGRYVG
ncbi:MAG TPA: class I SAM-dependent methyltransferase [Solirubrobacteraceae bacterium]|nr:class I SAM-dependent methyltransferase [Solirubrobacteraceae bacterium]